MYALLIIISKSAGCVYKVLIHRRDIIEGIDF